MIDGFKLIGEAIKDFINGESYSTSFTTLRRNQVYWQVDSSVEITGFVAPITVLTSSGTRKRAEKTYRFGFYMIQQMASVDSDAQVVAQDEMMKLVDEVEASIEVVDRILDLPIVTINSQERSPMDSEAMLTAQTFVGGFPMELTEAC